VAALDVAEYRAAGATEEGCAACGVDVYIEDFLRVEAKKEGDSGVAEDMHVEKVTGEGAAGSVGGGDAQGEVSDKGWDVVSEEVACGGGFEGGGGDWWVASEPRFPDDVGGGADVGHCGGDVGLGRRVDGGDGLDT